ncbi:MAG: DASH family cryptochrome [Cellvibrionaceae bacterium]|nr:DASH family cryptochrome [Cellvibrionaceae bacterium]
MNLEHHATAGRAINGLYWFTNDLRIEDNPSLWQASQQVAHLACAYIINPSWFRGNRYNLKTIGEQRWLFLYESLLDLQAALAALGQHLLILYESPIDAIPSLITQYNIDAIYSSQNAGYYENQHWQTLQQRYPQLRFQQYTSHTLFEQAQLPTLIEQLPQSFSQFRKLAEPLLPQHNSVSATQLPPPAKLVQPQADFKAPQLPGDIEPQHKLFKGGARAAKQQLQAYFNSHQPSYYKQTRNALDGWQNSSKFSPWLANGSLSVRLVLRSLRHYEATRGANESTYWLCFELLWREYFQWLAHASGRRLFSKSGTKRQKVLSSFYPERFQRRCQGNTPYPLVNACMKQLNATGYMTNRGRQIVASCFVNELALDWRFGAAYFEQQLIDYDVAANWGNWQYLAGVGSNPRGKRHFHLPKQQASYDPEGTFIAKWQGASSGESLDSVDAADWPCD